MAQFKLGFGEYHETITIPDERIAGIIRGGQTRPLSDISAAIAECVRKPIASPPLAEAVKAGERVCIIVSDITRSWIGYEQFLPTILNELNAIGVQDQNITVLVALGAHRRQTLAESTAAYGAEVVSRVAIEQSFAKDEADFAYVGTTSFGSEVYLNKHAVLADKVIITGGIAYHSMAGFGGGRKSIVPGIARYSTIQDNHRLCLNNKPGAGISEYAYCGSLSENLMHHELLEMAGMLNPAFLINAVHTPEGQLAAFVAGDWRQAWLAGCQLITDIYGVPFTEKADIVIASAGGAPKDINLYQGTKAMDNAVLAVKETGVVILNLACQDIGEPPDFSSWFEHDVNCRENMLRENFTVPGFVALKCGLDLQRIPHILVTLLQNKQFVEKAGFVFAESLCQAFEAAVERVGNEEYRVIIMPDAANTVPIFRATGISRK